MKDINFFSVYTDKSSAAYKRKHMMEIGIIILLIIVLIYAGLTFWKMSMERETQQINEFLMSEEAQKSIAEYNLQAAKLEAIQNYNAAADNLIGSMDKTYKLTSEKLDIISKAMPVNAKVKTLSYANGELNLIFASPSLATAAQTQVRLQKTELFQSVELLGATSEEAGGYSSTIHCIMKVGEVE